MRRAGLALLILVMAIVLGYRALVRPASPGAAPGGGDGAGAVATVRGTIGGEKAGFLRDPDVARVLREPYRITVDPDRAGSIEMVTEDSAGRDFLWPSSQVALELYRKHAGKQAKAEVIFNSPLVLYSRQLVAEALVRNGIVRKVNETYYVVQFPP